MWSSTRLSWWHLALFRHFDMYHTTSAIIVLCLIYLYFILLNVSQKKKKEKKKKKRWCTNIYVILLQLGLFLCFLFLLSGFILVENALWCGESKEWIYLYSDCIYLLKYILTRLPCTWILLHIDEAFNDSTSHASLVTNWKWVQDNGEKFTSLLNAISAYAEGFSADPIIRRAFYLWKKLETQR